MKPTKHIFNCICILALGLIAALGCAEEGTSGDSPLDCGDHGSEHEGHCHCDDGYLWNGSTCVPPEDITESCEEQEHHEEACVCPNDGACPCEGEIQRIAGQDYCVPSFDDEH